MTTETLQPKPVNTSALFSKIAERPWTWLLLGAAASFFAVGARWDIAFCAWLAPFFLLRFSRSVSPMAGLASVWTVSVAMAFIWGWQLAVPIQASTVFGHVLFGTAFTLPYIIDRFLHVRSGFWGSLFLFPCTIAICEYLFGTFSPLGTAYGTRAITQSENLPLLQVISIAGPYSIGFLIGCFATFGNALWRDGLGDTRAVRHAGGFAILMAVLIFGGYMRLNFLPPVTEYVQVAGVSPSRSLLDSATEASRGFPADAASEPVLREKAGAAFSSINSELFEQSRRAARAGSKIVLWAEMSGRVLEEDLPDLLAEAASVAREEGIYLLVANAAYTNEAPYSRNETHLLGPDGSLLWSYQKARPVFGMEHITPGDGKVPVVSTPFGRISNVICFDADFPDLLRVNADIMLVPGFDWPKMGETHTLSMARLRAIESGYALFRQDNIGMSAAFDHQGRVLARQDTTGEGPHIMFADLPVKGGVTLYRLIGDLLAWLCLAVLAGFIGLGLVRRTS